MAEEFGGFGVIGLGLWGETHLQVYTSTPGCRLLAVCDLDADLARRRAEEYGVPRWTTDYRELLAEPGLSAVSIATPDFAHYELAAAAIAAGKHVLLEKPMTTRLDQAEALAQAARAAGVTVMVDFHNRWNPAFVTAREAILAGEVGQIATLSLLLNDTLYVPTQMLSWAAKSSVGWFLGAHVADLARWLTGEEVTRVFCVARSRTLSALGVDTPDFMQTILELSGGAVAHLENCWIMSDSQPNLFDLKLELFGAQGSLYVDMATNRMLQKYTPAGGVYPDLAVRGSVHGKPRGFGLESIRHFAECVLTGAAPLVSLDDGVENVRIVEAMHRSAELGQPVDLDGMAERVKGEK